MSLSEHSPQVKRGGWEARRTCNLVSTLRALTPTPGVRFRLKPAAGPTPTELFRERISGRIREFAKLNSLITAVPSGLPTLSAPTSAEFGRDRIRANSETHPWMERDKKTKSALRLLRLAYKLGCESNAVTLGATFLGSLTLHLHDSCVYDGWLSRSRGKYSSTHGLIDYRVW